MGAAHGREGLQSRWPILGLLELPAVSVHPAERVMWTRGSASLRRAFLPNGEAEIRRLIHPESFRGREPTLHRKGQGRRQAERLPYNTKWGEVSACGGRQQAERLPYNTEWGGEVRRVGHAAYNHDWESRCRNPDVEIGTGRDRLG